MSPIDVRRTTGCRRRRIALVCVSVPARLTQHVGRRQHTDRIKAITAYCHPMKHATTILLVLSCASKLAASPTSDLSSPSPAIRAAAAQVLRASYTPPLQTKWDSLLATLKVGDAMTNVEAILRARGIKSNGGGRGGAGFLSLEYRLDEAWLLRCQDPIRFSRSRQGNPACSRSSIEPDLCWRECSDQLYWGMDCLSHQRAKMS